MEFDTSMADAAYALADKWDAARDAKSFPFSAEDIKDFSANQVALFLDTLAAFPTFSKPVVQALDDAYSLDSATNPEISVRPSQVVFVFGVLR